MDWLKANNYFNTSNVTIQQERKKEVWEELTNFNTSNVTIQRCVILKLCHIFLFQYI